MRNKVYLFSVLGLLWMMLGAESQAHAQNVDLYFKSVNFKVNKLPNGQSVWEHLFLAAIPLLLLRGSFSPFMCRDIFAPKKLLRVARLPDFRSRNIL